jgi:hypothetical protein
MSTEYAHGPTDTAEDALARAEDAKARRAARKAARAAIPPPERDHAYDHLGLDQLRELRAALGDEETKIAYWRRVISGKLDSVRTGATDREPVADLSGVLHEADHALDRIAVLDVVPIQGLAPLPDLAEVWGRRAAASDPTEVAQLVADLEDAATRLEALRDEVTQRAEHVTRELIARYREEPLLALQTLPGDPLGRTILR